jgi:hypothetical protein
MPGAPSSVPGEAERDLPRPRFRSPLTEDHPSARCVLLHHRERAAAYGDGAWLVAAGYWLATLPVLAVNQAAAAVHFLTENTGRGWFVITLSAVVIILIAVH